MLLERIVSFKYGLMHVQMYAWLMKKKKENSHEDITWSEMGKQKALFGTTKGKLRANRRNEIWTQIIHLNTEPRRRAFF